MQDIISFMAVVLVVFSGAFFGRLFLFIAPEENLPGKLWFKILSSSLLALALYFGSSTMIYGSATAFIAFCTIMFAPERYQKDETMNGILTGILGLVMGILLFHADASVLVSSLAFMFSISFSSLIFYPASRDVNVRKGIVKHKSYYLRQVLLPYSTIFVAFLFILM